MTIQLKASEQYFSLVLLIMLYKMVLAFESEDEILKCDHSTESYLASHADVLGGSSRVPAPRTSAETNSHFRSSANYLCLNRPISIDSL